MMGAPETQYVEVGGHDVAYQVIGDGAVDLLYCWGLGSHVDMVWDRPGIAEFFHRLAGFSRLFLFDQRGTGASDRIDAAAPPTWQSTGAVFWTGTTERCKRRCVASVVPR